MTNLARTQVDWNALGREWALFLGPLRELKNIGRKHNPRRARIQVVDEKSVNGFTSSWILAGPIFGTNTDEDGRLCVRIQKDTPGAGQATVSLYRAAGGVGSDLMAQGVGVYPGTITLTQQNASGLSGSVVLNTITASETDDKHTLLVFPDWIVRARAVFNGSQPEHGALLAAYLGAMSATLQAMSSAAEAWRTASLIFMRTRLKTFQKSAFSDPINKSTKNDQGAIVTNYFGLLEDMRGNMIDEATAGAQTVQKNVVSVSAPVFDPRNQGQGNMATPTIEEWFPSASGGLITLACVDDTLGAEKFAVSLYRNDTGDTLTAGDNLQIARTFADPAIGISSMLLTRLLTITGSSLDFATAADWSFSGESTRNTANGTLYTKVIASGGGSVTSKIAIGAGAASTIFQFTYKGASHSVSMGGTVTTAALAVAALQADSTFAAAFVATATGPGGGAGSTYLTITLKSTADGEYGTVATGTFNGQGGTGQDTFTNNTIIGQFRVDGYTSTLYTAATQVFTTTNAVPGGVVTVSAVASSGLSGTGKIGTVPTHTDTGNINLNPFQVKNVNKVADKITVNVSVTSVGEFQKLIADLFGYEINSAASSPTISDKYVSAGTFPPYSVLDP